MSYSFRFMVKCVPTVVRVLKQKATEDRHLVLSVFISTDNTKESKHAILYLMQHFAKGFSVF